LQGRRREADTCVLSFHCVVCCDKCCNFCENESLAESVSPHDFAKRSSLVISKQNEKKKIDILSPKSWSKSISEGCKFVVEKQLCIFTKELYVG
jgi:hypothetical protein